MGFPYAPGAVSGFVEKCGKGFFVIKHRKMVDGLGKTVRSVAVVMSTGEDDRTAWSAGCGRAEAVQEGCSISSEIIESRSIYAAVSVTAQGFASMIIRND